MKILILSHFFPPSHNAGAEKRALGYALALRMLGHDVQVVCVGTWEQGAQHWNGFTDEVYQGVPVRRAHINWKAAPDPNRYLYNNPITEAHLEEWLTEWKPDVAHVISLLTLSGSVIRALKRCGLPVVFTLTDFWLICPKISLVREDQSLCDGQVTSSDCLKCLMWNTKAYQRLRAALPERQATAVLGWVSRQPGLSRRRGLRGLALDMDDRKRTLANIAGLVDCFTAPSTFLAQTIENSGMIQQPVRIIHSGHDLSWVHSMPDKQLAEKVRFGFVGQIIPVKGLSLLIAAFQATSIPAAELLIFGEETQDPEYVAQLKEAAQPSDNIQFLGAFPHSQLGEVLSQMDVLVVPSQWHENNPRVIQEAFAAKTPVIASNMGGIAEFVQHGVNGLLFKHDSVEDLRTQITRVIDDPALIQQMKQGIGPVKSIADEIRGFIEIYRNLIQSPS